jgi:hypothetical protein
MGVGDILDTAFGLYRRRFATFATISCVVYVPYAFVMALVDSWFRSATEFAAPTPGGFWTQLDRSGDSFHVAAHGSASFSTQFSAATSTGFSPLTLIFAAGALFVAAVVFLSLVYPLCSSALLVNISADYLGEEIGAIDSYARAFKRLGALLTCQFVAMLCIAFGFLFFVVPGVVFSLWFMLLPAVVLLERPGGAFRSLGRSRALMSGNLGKGFLLGLTVWLLSLVIAAGGGAILKLVPWPTEFIGDFCGALLPGLMLPLSIGSIVLFYYDLRIRKEGFDLEHLAAKMGGLS